jgi:hypothetical protein
VRGIVFNVSGAHLMTDLKGNSENDHLFEWPTGFLINVEKVAFIINYLRTIAPLAKVVWLGPFVEARVNFRDPPSIARDAFKMNPVSLHHFKELDAEIAREVAEGPQTFKYLPFTDVLQVDQISCDRRLSDVQRSGSPQLVRRGDAGREAQGASALAESLGPSAQAFKV